MTRPVKCVDIYFTPNEHWISNISICGNWTNSWVDYLVIQKYMPRILKRVKAVFVICFRKEIFVVRKGIDQDKRGFYIFIHNKNC